jgi:hypothetical protein
MQIQLHEENDHGKRTAKEKQGSKETQKETDSGYLSSWYFELWRLLPAGACGVEDSKKHTARQFCELKLHRQIVPAHSEHCPGQFVFGPLRKVGERDSLVLKEY